MLKRWLLVIVVAIAMWPQPASAATPPNGITVSPAFQQIQLPTDEPSDEIDFTVINHRPSPETIQLYTQDFNALSDSGGLFFVGTNPTALQKKYGLASWIDLPQGNLSLLPQQTAKLVAYVRNDNSLAPGGHYGAVMFALSDNKANTAKSNQISVHPIASSLLFVNKIGGDVHSLNLTAVEAPHPFYGLPSSVNLRFFNSGNTHVVPRGTVTLTDPQGRLVSQGVINENSDIILPQLYRKYAVPMKTVAATNQPGRYKLTVDFRFDGETKFHAYQTTILLTTVAVYLALGILGVFTVAAAFIGWRIWRGRVAHRPVG